MNVCRNCAFFNPDKDRIPYGSCERWNVGYGYAGTGPFKMPLNEVVVEDDEGWGMLVGPDFGCVLWKSADGQ
jgi:hypothetical protein